MIIEAMCVVSSGIEHEQAERLGIDTEPNYYLSRCRIIANRVETYFKTEVEIDKNIVNCVNAWLSSGESICVAGEIKEFDQKYKDALTRVQQ